MTSPSIRKREGIMKTLNTDKKLTKLEKAIMSDKNYKDITRELFPLNSQTKLRETRPTEKEIEQAEADFVCWQTDCHLDKCKKHEPEREECKCICHFYRDEIKDPNYLKGSCPHCLEDVCRIPNCKEFSPKLKLDDNSILALGAIPADEIVAVVIDLKGNS